jgi:putative transcriptional regulator
MSVNFITRLGLTVTALLLPPALLNAALPSGADAPGRASLAGQLLIAAPTMPDPRFHHTVILMVHHDQNGALGIVINRPVAERSIASLLEALGEKEPAVTGTVRIFAGGPVQPDIGFVIHGTDYHRADTIEIDGRLAVTSSREILHDIADNRGPAKSLIAFGYAGWAPGQLDGEMAQRTWFVTPADAKLIFDEDRDKVWDEAFKRRTQDL